MTLPRENIQFWEEGSQKEAVQSGRLRAKGVSHTGRIGVCGLRQR